MSEATATNHLSIGEVLSLVQEDFPDVTISKIRFLESQGLIAPERTGSGYRKFFGADIERLRWILHQQRDNFLPLKVIKKMLDDGVDLSGTIETQPTLWATADQSVAASAEQAPTGAGAASGARSSPATSGSAANSNPDPASPTSSVGTQTQTDPAVGGRTERSASAPPDDGRSDEERTEDVERATYRSPSHPAVASAPPPTSAPKDVSSTAPRTGSTAPAKANSPRSSAPGTAGGKGISAGDAEVGEHAASNGRPAHSTPADVVAALQEDPRAARARRQKVATRDSEHEPAEGVDPGSGDAATVTTKGQPVTSTGAEPGLAAGIAAGPPRDELLSAEELCETCGIRAELLADLEQYGLVVAASLGGRSAYDAEAVDVARMAATYAELGVEPRHLRMYKVSAEREAGFVEQLVVPLIKQRNPAARQLAVERSDALLEMGADLHAALLRRQLRRIIGG